MAIKFNGQDYRSLYRSLVYDRKKFVDSTFPPEPRSICAGSAASDIEWRRPTELVSDPHLVVDGFAGSDVMQGERGNAWFVTASAALTTRTNLVRCVMPNDCAQDYGSDFHPGIFQFVFSRHGGLYEVVIDDLLPTRKGRLVYAHSGDTNEFWSALLEKAYAKLHGDYASLKYGRVVDAIASFVRGIPEHWNMREIRAEIDADSDETQMRLAKQFQTYLSKQAVLLFSLQPDNKTTRMGDWTKESLVYGRGYILSEVHQAKLRDEINTVTLLKFQNAWFDLEWTGPWSDGSPEWNSVSLEFKDNINYRDKKDGIFWMSIGDALKQFSDIDICVVTTAGSTRSWLTFTFKGEWGSAGTPEHDGPNAGGSYEYPQSFITNPQYLLQITGHGPQVVSFCLEQGDPSTACSADGQLEIGMDLFSVEVNRRCRFKDPPDSSWIFARVPPSRQPSVLLGATFHPGQYVLMPCTKKPGQTQRYTLRSFSQLDYSVKVLPEFNPKPSGCCSSCHRKKAVTRLVITKITGLNGHLKQRGVTTSVRVTCGGSDIGSCQSRYVAEDAKEKDSWKLDFKILLFRHKLVDPIDVDVLCQCVASFTKTFVGVAAILDKECASQTEKEIELFRNDKEIPVKLFCTVQSVEDLDYF